MESVKTGLMEFVKEVGRVPVEVLTDRGNDFNFMKEIDEGHRRTAACHPQSNGRIEGKHTDLIKVSRIENVLITQIDFPQLEEEKLLHEPVSSAGLRYVPRRSRTKADAVWKGTYEIVEVLNEATVTLDNGSIAVPDRSLLPANTNQK
jgi:hypothetical protein